MRSCCCIPAPAGTGTVVEGKRIYVAVHRPVQNTMEMAGLDASGHHLLAVQVAGLLAAKIADPGLDVSGSRVVEAMHHLLATDGF